MSPRTIRIALLAFAAVSSPAIAQDACERTKWVTIGSGDGATVVDKLANKPGFLFVSGMTVDADGSPKAYHPNNTGLDDIKNAKSKDGSKWVGVVTKDGQPVIQGDLDPAPGYYVSPTTLEDPSRKTTDPRRYVDAEAIPYIALPPGVLQADGARMGDFAAIVNLKNNALAFAMVADRGPVKSIGEGSIALAKALGINSNPRSGGAGGGLVYLVFSESGDGLPHPVEEINAKGAELLANFGGIAKLMGCVTDAPPGSEDPVTGEVQRLSQKFASALKRSRYMEQECEPSTYPGWEGFPVQKCVYSVTDKGGVKKSATVIMLNPSIGQLSRWIATTCREVNGSVTSSCTEKMMNLVIGASGGQFPVGGIVLEDILPEDGVYEIYSFRDGVTVKIDGVPHRGIQPPTQEQIELSLSGSVTWVGKYARLQSTTPAQYRSNAGNEDVGSDAKRTSAWLMASRRLYQAAWSSDRNEMMIARAREQF